LIWFVSKLKKIETMKKILNLIFLISFLSCSNQFSDENIKSINENLEDNNTIIEKVFNYDFVLTDQIEVDLFAKERCTKINGDIIISFNQNNTNPITI
jgi:hypothetical protein